MAAQSFGSTVDVSDLRDLALIFKGAEKSVKANLQTSMRAVGQIVQDYAAAFASWSVRIPPSMKIRASGLNVYVSAGNATAPHAPVYEHQGNPGVFSHPVFGNRAVWVQEAARPFLSPATDVAGPEVLAGISDAVSDALAEVGLG